MTFDFECPKCGSVEEHYVPTFESEDEICGNCGTKMQRLIANSAQISVWKFTHIPEIDGTIRFRSMSHAKEVARAKGLRINQATENTEYLKPYSLELHKREEERLMRQPVHFDMGRHPRRATG
jgi:hypothetical protein